jgi:hypothetical protein
MEKPVKQFQEPPNTMENMRQKREKEPGSGEESRPERGETSETNLRSEALVGRKLHQGKMRVKRIFVAYVGK